MITAERTSNHQQDGVARGSCERPPLSPRIAYLLSQYPARSHTFFLNEILGLRARGLHIEAASINAPDRPLGELPAQEASEARQTFYIKGGSRMRALLALCALMARKPGVVGRGLRAVWRLPALSPPQRLFWFFYLAEALLVGQWMRRRGLSHLHVHFGGPVASVGMLVSAAWQIPYSLTIHGPEELLDPLGCQLPAKLERADFVLCISEYCRTQLQHLLPSPDSSKLSVIRLGVDPLLLTPAAAPVRTRRSRLVLVCVGRLVPEKGHQVLIDALQLLCTRDIAVEAVFVGAGPLQAELQRSVRKHGLGGHITFTSGLSHAETLAHVRAADIFALASFAEGVPVALMEAMSLGVPCVSTTVAGIPELIRSGEDGLLVPPGSAAALADALQALASDESLRHRLGSAGRRRVISDYNLPLNLERLAQHFRACAAKQVATPREAQRPA